MEQSAEHFVTNRYHCLVYHRKESEDLYMISCGTEKCLPEKRFDTRGREGYHVHVILSGKGKLCVNNVDHSLHFGQMFVTKDGEDCWYQPDAADPWTYCWMSFGGNNAERYVKHAGFTEGVNVLNSHVEVLKFQELVQMVLERPELNLANDLRRLGILHQFIGLMIESNYKAQGGKFKEKEYAPDGYVQHALDFIHGNYAVIRVNDIARNIGIHRSYLTNIFKKSVGVSPQEYLLQYRMEKAKDLLKNTSLPIQEISQRVGYDNPLTFSKMFKSVYDLSPRNYRNMNRPGKEEEQS